MKKRKAAIIISAVLILIFFALFYSMWRSKYGLCVTKYQINSDKTHNPIRIVQLTDLHNSEFGKDNVRLISTVERQNPDLIFMTGDMINYSNEDISVAVRLTEKLSKIAPVYFSYGNHEDEYETIYGKKLNEIFAEAGATVLDEEYIDTKINGQPVRIGGIYGYCLPADVYESRKNENEFLNDFQSTDRYKILLCHMPVCWIENGSLDYWDVDAVFSGHAHGGQIVLPFVGGVYAPDQGWFPGCERGLFRDGDSMLVLSGGLGTSGWIPRINNVPEVVMVDIQ